MNLVSRRFVLIAAFFLAAVFTATAAGSTNAFFPFCIDWHDSRKRGYAEQAVMLKELGYDGVGHIWLVGVAERLKTLDDAKLKLFQITMTVDLTPGKAPYDAKFKDVRDGKNADYIPALAKVDPNLFGIAVVTADGKVHTAGDVKTEVSIQSIARRDRFL